MRITMQKNQQKRRINPLFFCNIISACTYNLVGGMNMEKQETIGNYTHGISLVERKNLVITGVKKIENFDTEQFLLETSMGFILVKGSELELIKLDTLQGNVSIRGMISGINYLDENNKKSKENGIFNRLFK